MKQPMMYSKDTELPGSLDCGAPQTKNGEKHQKCIKQFQITCSSNPIISILQMRKLKPREAATAFSIHDTGFPFCSL